jgi:excisionase family DNA binding protein
MSDSIWVTVKEVAQFQNCSERYVLKLIAQNVLKAKKYGRKRQV